MTVSSVRTLAYFAAAVLFAGPVIAGPQHFGFGQGYFVALEQVGTTRRLAVYETPIRAKDGTWITRWMDRTTDFSQVLPGGLAVGDFFPADVGKERVALVSQTGGIYSFKVLNPPEYFCTGSWSAAVSGQADQPLTGTFLGTSAGDLTAIGKDSLLVLLRDTAGLKIASLTPRSGKANVSWTVNQIFTVPDVPGDIRGFACGDFWKEKKDGIAIAARANGLTVLHFFQVSGSSLVPIVNDGALDLPDLAPFGLTAGDYTKDGFDTLTLLPSDPAARLQVRSAPAKPAQAYNPGYVYNGKAYSGQWLPGNGGASSIVDMTGTLESSATRLGVGAGRVFGYVISEPTTQLTYIGNPDAEIAFTYRTPTKFDRQPYGWPTKGETVNWQINLKNNGQTTLPAAGAVLKVWLGTQYRNADTNPATCDTPDLTIPITTDLPPFDPNTLNYQKYTVGSPWPYDLIPVNPGATWKKINLAAVGERWLVVSLTWPGDTNLRNNRYEAAYGSHGFHPVFRENSDLGDRAPTVLGDPPSQEYCRRKLADAVQSMYERSKLTDGGDVLERVYFDGYEIGWADDLTGDARLARWKWIQDRYEGWRQQDIWAGRWGPWERFNWGDGGAELHETTHLFQPLGDLYQYYAFPVWMGPIRMADGTPVQQMTYIWGPDSFGTGEAVLNLPLVTLAQYGSIGVRNNSIAEWWTFAPDNIFVRVLDRNGNPVPGAKVTLTPYASTRSGKSGVTGADGRWDTGLPSVSPSTDEFGRKHFRNDLSNYDLVATVQIGTYQDAAMMGAETTNAYGHVTAMYQSFITPTEWTWDFRTNYQAAVPAPDFSLVGAIQGSSVQLGVTGPSGSVYKVYRRWEPSYARTAIGQYTATGSTLNITQDMAAADSRGGGRARAIYEVTRVTADGESLPRTVSVIALKNALGITTVENGDFLVAANAGIANPFGILLHGATPYQELFYHFRFGHTARKIVPSRLTPGRYYATLTFSDMDPDFRFDVIDPPAPGQGYDVRNTIGNYNAAAYATVAPYTLRLSSAAQTVHINPGDEVQSGDATAQVLSVAGDTLTLDRALWAAGQSWPGFSALRTAGRVGGSLPRRELNGARGLGVLVYGDRDYEVIADTGNGRVLVWADDSTYLANWQSPDPLSRPVAVAADPTAEDRVFVLVRRSDRQSSLYLFRFDGSSLTVEPGYPIAVTAGDAADGTEMGLASAYDSATGETVLAITDANTHTVQEWRLSGAARTLTATYNKPIGTYAGAGLLVKPVDVAFVSRIDGLELYALDKTGGDADRVVQLAIPQSRITLDDVVGALRATAGLSSVVMSKWDRVTDGASAGRVDIRDAVSLARKVAGL